MKLGLGIKTALTQTLTPQQIQYLKLLQLPIMNLEAHVRSEIEMNPMLEEDGFALDELTLESIDEGEERVKAAEEMPEVQYDNDNVLDSNNYQEQTLYIEDKAEPFEFQKMLWDATDESNYNPNKSADDDDENSFQIKDVSNFYDDLINQLRMFPLSKEQFITGKWLIGSIDEDGYLRRDLNELLEEINEFIIEENYNKAYSKYKEKKTEDSSNSSVNQNGILQNPANLFALGDDSLESLSNSNDILNGDYTPKDIFSNDEEEVQEQVTRLSEIDFETSEKMLNLIQRLDPPGIGSRNIQECLLAQLKFIKKPNAAQKLALEIIENNYEAFSKKHYHLIIKNLEITENYLKEAIEEIRSLNPRPGGDDYQSENNTVIPDFSIERDEETDEIIININDARIPTLRLSKAYDSMRKDTAYKKYNKETRDWIRTKREDAKFMIQAIKQRKSTMLKIMTAIAHRQRDFFDYGSSGLKPLIYKDVSEETGLDISTVCRIVNGKYVQSAFGTFELKYFFSESLQSDDGEDISTKVIKEALKKIIDEESKRKPFSDDKLGKELKDLGYNVARRTVAKYREQLNLPVARLRKELV